MAPDSAPERSCASSPSRVAARPPGAGGRRRLLVTASGDAGPRLRLLSAGEGVTLRGWLEPLTGFDTRWRWQHAVGTLHATELLDARRARAPLDEIANAARGAVLRGSDSLRPVDRALLAGFLLGDTRGVPDDVTERFRASGLTHLTAVSGENVAFVLALFAPLLRRLGLFGRLVGGVGGARAVRHDDPVGAVGAPRDRDGIDRAASRATSAGPPPGSACSRWRRSPCSSPTRSCSTPSASCCRAAPASASRCWRGRSRIGSRGPVWVREVLGVTAAAQIGVAPVLIPVFGSMPIVSLPANLVAVPLAAPLTMWGLATGVVGGVIRPFAPQVTALLTVPTAALLHALLAVADLASRVPFAIDGRAAWGSISLAAVAAAVIRVRGVPSRVRP